MLKLLDEDLNFSDAVNIALAHNNTYIRSKSYPEALYIRITKSEYDKDRILYKTLDISNDMEFYCVSEWKIHIDINDIISKDWEVYEMVYHEEC